MTLGFDLQKPFQQPKPTEFGTDNRVVVNQEQLHRFADLISGLGNEKPFDYVSPSLPPLTHPMTIEFFFVTTLQQFSFWTIQDDRYHQPLIDTIGGEELKGSFYLFHAYNRRIDTDPAFFSPERQANQTLNEMLELFRSDDGNDVMPAVELHLDAAHRYGRTMLELGWTPQSILSTASESGQPLKTLLVMLDHVGGYCEDPLRKKSLLLAEELLDRPERYFELGADEPLYPVMDYHLMRSCLRMGLIDVLDEELHKLLEDRRLISEQDEWAVRYASYRATEQLPELSGRSMRTVNSYLFFARKRCPEMTEPDCASCNADPVCAHHTELFQPVIRTDYY
ncbi:MAG: hypothetical protein JSV37_06705 [Anaerolineaceae bacterium]|nr:MAG: hypothetical protein JSV37_06705 [Anaerolineaceae bacterium]